VLLHNQNAVIYGGGGAIGGAVAWVFAREGARVFIAGRHRPGLKPWRASKLAVGDILGHSVSSAGKEVFSRVLAAELAPRNIRVICIRPHGISDAPASGSYTQDLFKPAAAAAGLSVQSGSRA
jgi:NAD(P)-dependent dehydrogenase (short-subunit alcohol dehydrogenase family)